MPGKTKNQARRRFARKATNVSAPSTTLNIFQNRRLQIRICLYLSFILLGLISITRGSDWLIFIALLPLLAYVQNMNDFSRKTVLWDFYAGGFMLALLSNTFALQMASQNWTVSLTGWFSYVSRGLALLLGSATCALAFLLLGTVLYKIKNSNHRIISLVILWPVAEIMKAYIYVLVLMGPGASISPNFNMGALAVSAAGTVLVYLARFVGFYGLTATVVVINVALYFIVYKRKFLLPGLALTVIFLMTVAGWQSGNFNTGKHLNISVVQLNESDSLSEWDKFDWPPEGTDLLVLPEYSEFFSSPDKQPIAARLSDNGVGVHSFAEGESVDSTNQLQYFNNKAEIINRQNKTFLIPTGEYLPYLLHFSFWAMAQDRVIYDFRTTQQIKPGDTPEVPFDTGELKIGALVCSGVTALNEYSRVSRQGADILINSASLSFLSKDSLYHIYARNMARFHAVSNSKPFVQSSRSGESFVMDRQGRIVKLVSGESSIFSLELSF